MYFLIVGCRIKIKYVDYFVFFTYQYEEGLLNSPMLIDLSVAPYNFVDLFILRLSY